MRGWSVAVRVIGAVLRCDAGRIPLVGPGVPERLGRHLVRAVRVVGAVGRREAGRVTGFGVRRRLVVVMAGLVILLVPGGRGVVVTMAVVVVAAAGAVVHVRGARGRLRVRGQQRVVAVRVVRAQGWVQAGRVTGGAGQDRGNGLRHEYDGLQNARTMCLYVWPYITRRRGGLKNLGVSRKNAAPHKREGE